MADAIELLNFALNQDMARMRSIANNVSNMNTDGYKREIAGASFSNVLADQISNGAQLRGARNLTQESSAVEVLRDMSQGAMKFTGSIFDMAIDGPDFFVAAGQTGDVYLRSGAFQLDNLGRLTLPTGEVVQSESGAIYLENGPFQVDERGVVQQGENIVGKLLLARVKEGTRMAYQGEGRFVVPDAAIETNGGIESRIMQSYLEASNVDNMREMTQMIETTRRFEMSNKVLKGYDLILDRAINVLGEF